MVDLARGDADIAIRTAEPTEPNLVVGYRFAWGSCLYASEACVAQHGLPDTPDDLRRQTICAGTSWCATIRRCCT